MADQGVAQTIVFFDGHCHLCNGFVDFAIRRDKLAQLQFAPLQGPTAQKVLGSQNTEQLETVFVWHQGQLLSKSDAVLKVLSHFGGSWKFLAQSGKWVPRKLRDRLYDSIAKRRYLWFGERATCRLPTPEEKSRFLN